MEPINSEKQQLPYSCGSKNQISKKDKEQLLKEKIIWTWVADDELYLMCGNCGHKWIVKIIKDIIIPIKYLTCEYCHDINYDVYRISRQLEENNKVLEEKDKALEENKKALTEKDKALTEKDKIITELLRKLNEKK